MYDKASENMEGDLRYSHRSSKRWPRGKTKIEIPVM